MTTMKSRKKRLEKLERLVRKLHNASSYPGLPPVGSAQQEGPPPLPSPGKALVIMAHPDDAEFTCSGTVAKWCAEGWEVRYVLVTGGDKGTHDPEMYPEKLAAIREEEQRAACRVLGVKECIFLGYPDGFTVEGAELRGQVVRLLRLYRPDVVITWDAFRGTFNHRDHRNVGTAVATRSTRSCATGSSTEPTRRTGWFRTR
jgi:LmbE family N-acetylglucosaminyl deacetylase